MTATADASRSSLHEVQRAHRLWRVGGRVYLDAHHAFTKLVFQSAIDTFHRAPRVVAPLFGRNPPAGAESRAWRFWKTRRSSQETPGLVAIPMYRRLPRGNCYIRSRSRSAHRRSDSRGTGPTAAEARRASACRKNHRDSSDSHVRPATRVLRARASICPGCSPLWCGRSKSVRSWLC